MASKFLALDVGQARIGLALANHIARIAAPLPAVVNDADCLTQLQAVIDQEEIDQLVVGWPRNLAGEMTDQTRYVEQFIDKLAAASKLPVARQDEAVTSLQAEAELNRRGGGYSKGDIDSLSAVYILEDYLQQVAA